MIIIIAGSMVQGERWAETHHVHGPNQIVTPSSNPILLHRFDARNLVVLNGDFDLTPELGYVIYRCFFKMRHGEMHDIRQAISQMTKGGMAAIDAYEDTLSGEKEKSGKETA